MPNINLTATDSKQQTVLENLIHIVSDTLAEKINNGVYIEKDGKRLLNKKDLSTFMRYAEEEAKKTLSAQQRTGTQAVCVHGDDIMSWAIHYFEEDSIEGKLYNEDGTEYKPPVPEKPKTMTPIPTKPATPPKPKEPNLFDMIAASEKQEQQQTTTEKIETPKTDEPSIEQIADSLQQAVEQKQQSQADMPLPKPQQPDEERPKNPLYEKYITYVNRYPDSVIAMRVGDFYEVFGKKATLIADKANLTLTGRDMGLEQRIPMVGFPWHAADAYFKKIRQCYSLVVIDGEDVRKLDEFGIEDIIDGDNELTDEEEMIDDLTEEEMRQFDGDIQEPLVVPKTVLSETQKQLTKFILTKDDIVSEPSVLKRLHEIFGDILA